MRHCLFAAMIGLCFAAVAGCSADSPTADSPRADSTAAGDAFVGAFTVALCEGLPPAEALCLAAAAGALATTVRGAQPSLPPRPAIERLAARDR